MTRDTVASITLLAVMAVGGFLLFAGTGMAAECGGYGCDPNTWSPIYLTPLTPAL